MIKQMFETYVWIIVVSIGRTSLLSEDNEAASATAAWMYSVTIFRGGTRAQPNAPRCVSSVGSSKNSRVAGLGGDLSKDGQARVSISVPSTSSAVLMTLAPTSAW